METVKYKGYVIEFTNKEFNYIIKKDGILVYKSDQPFPFESEAEVNAKLIINRLEAKNDGWIIS